MAAVLEGLAQAKRREFATDDEVEAAFRPLTAEAAFTPRATRDLIEIAEYLYTPNPSAALAVRDAILRSLQKLIFPGTATEAEHSNTSRHLAEFRIIEPEIAFADLSDNTALAEALLRYTFAAFIDQ